MYNFEDDIMGDINEQIDWSLPSRQLSIDDVKSMQGIGVVECDDRVEALCQMQALHDEYYSRDPEKAGDINLILWTDPQHPALMMESVEEYSWSTVNGRTTFSSKNPVELQQKFECAHNAHRLCDYGYELAAYSVGFQQDLLKAASNPLHQFFVASRFLKHHRRLHTDGNHKGLKIFTTVDGETSLIADEDNRLCSLPFGSVVDISSRRNHFNPREHGPARKISKANKGRRIVLTGVMEAVL